MSEYKENDNIWYILHISDFHLTEDPEKNKYAKKALDSLAKALKDSRIKVKYLIHTGDMINSSDIYVEAANRISECKTYIIGTDEKKFDAGNFKKGVSINIIERFNKELEDIANKRFEIASCMMSDFISQINVLHSNVVICCGNHDVVRPIKAKNCEPECTLISAQNNEKSGVASYSCGNDVVDTFKPFEEFLKKMNVANSIAQQKTTNAQCFELDDLNLLVLNTNWPNPEKAKDGYFCVRCDQAIKNIKKCSNKLNVIVAHKPIYEICEAARLPYKRYIKTSFMAKIQEFIDDHGIYLCGDKHTRSIVASAFHDIPHYIGGEPLTKNKKGNNSFEVEYNLISVDGNNVGRARKIHLVSRDGNKWKCEFRLPDGLISKLYDISRPYINRYSLEMLKGTLSLHTWENICQTIYGWEKKERSKRFGAINSLYLATCKYRLEGIDDYNWTSNENIFVYLFRRLNEISKRGPGNLLNVRGEYSSGKSTFLGLLYIFLLYKYGKGEFKCIPAYFDLENNDVLQKIENGESYHNAAKYSFEKFTETIQVIANKEQQPVCYIIDGLDEQDCWSFSSEDSAGRGILDILSKIPGARYIMSFSQHRLPWFKDTLPVRKFSDRSDVMYFNPIDVQERGSKDARFASYVQAFKTTKMLSGDYTFSREHIDEYRMHEKDAAYEPRECEIIRKFRRLTISPGFLVHNFEYIFGQNQRCDVNQNYKYYIDKQNDECMEQIGYGFVHYATSMAYLFAYKGYTFEKFMHMSNDSIIGRKINEHHDKIYKTFLLIKKQQDVREYLIALHYNRELQYYAENPGEEIEKDSILNELITRNIAILIRLLWSDHNKFVIVCNKLLNRSDLNSCTLSMLVYILSNMDIMYPPIRDRLQKALLQKAEEVLIKQDDEKQTRAKERGESVSICNMENISEDDNPWRIIGNNMERLTQFVNLSLRHTILIYKFVDKSNTIGLAEELIKNKLLLQYNRQFQMLYYGDLTIRGEERKRALDPGKDIIGKGFDFHNTFMYLYFKLKSGENYFLKEFDMVTLCDLINSRLEKDKVGKSRITTFFFKESFSDKAKNILLMARELIASFLKGKKLADRNPFETYIATTKRKIDRRLKEMTALTEKSN